MMLMTQRQSTEEAQSHPRQRLRTWLIYKLDSGQCPGCHWIDQKRMLFKLVWKHYGRPGFNEERDAKIFRDWAQHTRRWAPGDPPDISTWKTRFRNALHKMPDVEEIVALHELEGDDPYRVYRFRTQEEVKKIKDEKQPAQTNERQKIPQYHPTSLDLLTREGMSRIERYNNLPPPPSSPLNLPPPPYMEHINSTQPTLKRFNSVGTMQKIEAIKDFLKTPEKELSQEITVSSNGMDGVADVEDLNKILQKMVSETFTNKNSSSDHHYEFPMTAIELALFFSEQKVGSKVINNKNGVRVANKQPPPVPTQLASQNQLWQVLTKIFGPLNAEQVYFPVCDEPRVQIMLDKIHRGLIIEATDTGDIYATRKCNGRIFYALHHKSAPQKLERDTKMLVFSHSHYFLPSLRAYKNDQAGYRPSHEVLFSFVQKWSKTEPFEKMLMRCSVSMLAAKKAIQEMDVETFSPLCSKKDSLDRMRENFEQMALSAIHVQ